ncbi:hypothetical protein HPQ64_15415 [Rhizobiales bacterium]|uniref:DUF6492 family protein n=1 Tax=Hongsoonwoonella zoysiae TaxID=2821844 RepID=UPI00156192B0|nr:DUF6492 family protein [Hongsoonwoonella zoysiae]NRG19079.1 hypothetical protein [Hongsoonwoonella zoysiae]
MPLRIQGNRDAFEAERTNYLLQSLSRHAAAGTFDCVVIAMPPSDIEAGRAAFAGWPGLNIRIMDETELVPEVADQGTVSGWTKQQIIKLAGAARLEGDFVLTLDADALCVKPISRDILLPSGKALIDPGGTHRTSWWNASARLLGVKKPNGGRTIGVTPVLMSSEICRRTLDRLTKRAPKGDWFEYLVKALRSNALHQYIPGYKHWYRWSEYTLYFLVGREEGLLDRYHTPAGTREHPDRLLWENSVWRFECFDRLREEEPGGIFLVVQSNMKEPYPLVREKMLEYGLIEPAQVERIGQ